LAFLLLVIQFEKEKKFTYSFPVKLSNMNLLMIDVFPTLWSPKNTILNFYIGPEIEFEAIFFGGNAYLIINYL